MIHLSTEVESAPGTDLAEVGQDLSDAIKSRFDKRNLILPILKLTQQLSKEVTEDKASSGEFVNSLTGQNYGNELELVIAGYFEGRFWTKDGQTFVSQSDIIPETWPHPDAGKPFADSLESEERWRERVNAGEIKWEGGPPISTTHNFIGYVVGEDETAPVRLSLMRTSVKAAKTILSLLSFEKQVWDRTVKVSAEGTTDKQQRPYFVVHVERGTPTQAEQRQFAVELATGIRQAQANVELVGDDGLNERPKAPAPDGGKGAVDID